ncbi:MAG: divalent-cation tolerance protein CutA [Chloroflexota bacterium]
MPETCCTILNTAGSQEEADRLANLLVSEKLAACVQIIPITSWYRWEGVVHHEGEYLLLIKTVTDLYPSVEAAILAHHSYEVPEIVQLSITAGLERYLGWIAESVERDA